MASIPLSTRLGRLWLDAKCIGFRHQWTPFQSPFGCPPDLPCRGYCQRCGKSHHVE